MEAIATFDITCRANMSILTLIQSEEISAIQIVVWILPIMFIIESRMDIMFFGM